MWFRRKVRHVDTALDVIPVQFQCPASWKRMDGNEQVRHCSHCDRKVYNLSEMSRFEARSLILREEGKLCVRYYLRPDGKIMTRDCGRAVQLRTRLGVAVGSALGALLLLLRAPTAPASRADASSDGTGFIAAPPAVTIMGALATPEPTGRAVQGTPMMQQVITGKIARPATQEDQN